MKTILTILLSCLACFGQGSPVINKAAPAAATDKGTAKPLLRFFNKSTAVAETVTVMAPSGKRTVTINSTTGEVTFGEGVTPSEASRAFYDAVGVLFRNKTCDARWVTPSAQRTIEATADSSDSCLISSDSVCRRFANEAEKQSLLAEQWRDRYGLALQYAQKTFQCMAEGVTKTNAACAKADLLLRDLQGPLPGQVIAKKKKGSK